MGAYEPRLKEIFPYPVDFLKWVIVIMRVIYHFNVNIPQHSAADIILDKFFIKED